MQHTPSTPRINPEIVKTLARLRIAIKLVAQIDSPSIRRDRAASALAIVDTLMDSLAGEIGASK